MLKANYKNSIKYLISSRIPFWGRKLIFQHLELHWSFQLFWLSSSRLRLVRKTHLKLREEKNCWSFRKDENSIDEPFGHFGRIYSSDPEIWVLWSLCLNICSRTAAPETALRLSSQRRTWSVRKGGRRSLSGWAGPSPVC